MEPTEPLIWSIFVDGSWRDTNSGTSVVLVSPIRHQFNCAMRFDFKTTNNVVKYEALLASL